MDPELLNTLHAEEDEYVYRYYNDKRNLPAFLRSMNDSRNELNYEDITRSIADDISQQIIDHRSSTYGRTYADRVFNRELWASTYEKSKDTIDDDKLILNDECGICLGEFTEFSFICSPNVCQHGFHCKCIRQVKDKKCPNCRKDYNYLVISSYNLKRFENSFGVRGRRLRKYHTVGADIRYLRGL